MYKITLSQEKIIYWYAELLMSKAFDENTGKFRKPAYVLIITYNLRDGNDAFRPNGGAKRYSHVGSHAAYELAEFGQIFVMIL